jgi:arylsulfatase A-like enzyme
LSALLALGLNALKASAAKEALPNIIYILADDLGYGDLGCYGQELFETPNIDRMAQEGMLFTQHYSGSSVCAPSRSCLMTGLHTGHTQVRGNKEIQPEGQEPLVGSIVTIAEVLQESGYVTGAFGKWGLGFPGSEGDPLNQGFDVFYGLNCQRLGHHYYPHHLWDNDRQVILEENAGTKTGCYAPTRIHEKTLEFIEANKDRPFFCYVPSIIPHAELFAPEENMAKYRGKLNPEKYYDGVDEGPSYRKGPYGTQPESHAAFAAMIDLLDQQVGEIRAKVEELGIAENTLIVFTSDNGPHREGGADPEYFNSNGVLRGTKRDLYEGGIRVPMVACWPGAIKAGKTSDHVSAFWDMYPTFASMAKAPIPADIDGLSLLPTLLSEGDQVQHDCLYWEFHEKGGRVALRKGNWKAVRYNVAIDPNAPLELYDLSKDPGEKHDVATTHPAIAKKLSKLLALARVPSDEPNFNFPDPRNYKAYDAGKK